MGWTCGTVSVVIRTKNESELLPTVLAAIAAQRCDGSGPGTIETIVVDSGSTDATVDIALRAGAQVVPITAASFTFGHALNVGIAQCRGELVAILSGHSVPVNDQWLANLVHPLMIDPGLAGVFGSQFGWERSTIFDNITKWMWGLNSPEPARFSGDNVPHFSNANACVRRSLALSVPYDETVNGAEDMQWAERVQALGWHTAYVPTAAVWHSHGVTLGHMLQRGLAGAPLMSSG